MMVSNISWRDYALIDFNFQTYGLATACDLSSSYILCDLSGSYTPDLLKSWHSWLAFKILVLQDLCNLVQPQKDKKLQVPQAMSKFSQVAALKLLHGLLRSLCGICIIQSPIIYYLKMAWEPETLSVCWCRCHRCHWQQWPFLICVLLSSIKRILWWQYYSISALDQLATHKPRASCRRSAQSLDLCLVNLSTTKKGSKRPKRAERFFTVLLMS